MTVDTTPVARTTAGLVQGLRLPGFEQFIEIPYGASPTGDRRFRPPAPAQTWDGVRDATAWTNRAPQNPDLAYGNAPQVFYAIQGDFYAKGMDEDSLTVNVWTPSTTDGRQRPVVFWIHGGGYTVGHAASESYDGARFAREHDIVFVSVTHRLNVFGFLALETITGPGYEGSGNAGMLDIVLALQWVRDNIAAFGGDPGNVTIVGESGGGAKVSILMVADIAPGLFHRAVCESGISLRANTMEQAQEYARAILAEFGGDLPRLLGAPVPELLAAADAVARSGAALAGPGPVIDGAFLTDSPLAIWRNGGGSPAPLLAGWTRDEVTAFATADLDLGLTAPEAFRHDFGAGMPHLVDRAAGLAALDRFLPGKDPAQLVAAARELRPDADDGELAVTLSGALLFQWPALRLAEIRAGSGKATYLYEFDWVSPHLTALGAPHSSDIGLFFGNVDLLYSTRGFASATAASAAMSRALAAFARTGDPNTGRHAEWAPYSPGDRAVMIFDGVSRVETDPAAVLRRALEAADPATVL
jgi:para-nitrobenzyl esterase